MALLLRCMENICSSQMNDEYTGFSVLVVTWGDEFGQQMDGMGFRKYVAGKEELRRKLVTIPQPEYLCFIIIGADNPEVGTPDILHGAQRIEDICGIEE